MTAYSLERLYESNRMATYSIQGADFEIREEAILNDAKQASRIFDEFDWQMELALQQKLEVAGKENCSPGLLINPRDFEHLHLCPSLDGSLTVYCTADVPTKIFGLLNATKSMLLESHNVKRIQVLPIITNFLDGNKEWLIAHLQEA